MMDCRIKSGNDKQTFLVMRGLDPPAGRSPSARRRPAQSINLHSKCYSKRMDCGSSPAMTIVVFFTPAQAFPVMRSSFTTVAIALRASQLKPPGFR